MRKINWDHLKLKLYQDIQVLPHFLKNPVQGMRHLPEWEWPTILVLQGIFAMGCSVLANLVERDFIGLITGIVIGPLVNYLGIVVGAGLFYYLFLFLFQREIDFRRIYLHVLFSSVPLMILVIVTSLLPPVILVGWAAALLLLYVGFTDNFHIPRNPLRNILIGIMALHVFYWGFQQVRLSNKHKSIYLRATPESLDILEKELNTDN